MSFFETLKAMGLFPNQQAPAQGGGDYTAGNPYGLDPAMLNQARWASLGNISSQLLALGQQMRPQDRAQMMGNMDLTGGLQQNLFNAAQMKLAQRRMMQDDLAIQQATDARSSLAEKIRSLPQGRLRDAAMFYLTAGDVDKAAEVIYKAEKRLNPTTGDFELVNSFDLSPIGGASVASGGIPMPAAPGEASTSITPPAASAGGVAPVPSAPAGGTVAVGGGQVDKLTTNWRRLTGDPNLTPEEARQISMEAVSKNDPAAGLTLYREIRKQQQAAAQEQAGQNQQILSNNRSSAEALTSKYEALAKGYDTIIGAGQRAAQLVTNGGMSASDKLATLYQFMKALDPEGAVRDGDVAMAQSIQATLSSLQQLAKSVYSADGTISEGVITQMAATMARLANDAAGRKELKRIEMISLAQGRQIPTEMVVPPDSGNQNMQAPIGIGIPRNPKSGPNQPITLQVTPAEKSDLENYSGNGG